MREKERWKFIPGFSHGYMVSDKGRVKSVARVLIRSNGRPQKVRERILKQAFDEFGYPMVRIDGKTIKVHRAVMLAFVGKRKVGFEIRHLDGDCKNNSLSNLAYGTAKENALDKYRCRKDGKIADTQKLTIRDANEIRLALAAGYKGVDLARIYGVSEQTICDIKHGRIYREDTYDKISIAG